ncbi:RING-CH-type domain-containing protein [Heracleum sosnowskyi]|uniref:RING-CH-type domain-containing protein n=1 Tax=Heracleum sosnowskyi TaxID=360622 RepID=A0AAD8M026_9APIA|nr:RING-CH-type domain-containing protein [Heracleum sosnowskyi]
MGSSNQGRDSDSEIEQVSRSRKESSVVATDCVVNIDNGVDEARISVGTTERECRICMLSLDSESGIGIELGCSCKDGMEAAHQHCAETWFRSKGNNICEICNSIAQNVVVPSNTTSRQQISQVNTVSTNAVTVSVFEANTLSTYAVPVLASQVIPPSTNAYSVPRSNINSLSTNAVSVPEPSTSNMPRSNVNSLSTNAVSVPVSSTSDSQQCSVPWPFFFAIILFLVWMWLSSGGSY